MNKQSGSSLVEVVLVVGIMGLISMGMASMLVRQQSEMKALYQKSDMLELRSQMLSTFIQSRVCTWQLAGKTIDLSTTTTNVMSPTVIDFGATPLYEGLDATSSIIAKAGALLPISLNGVVVSRVLFKDIFATGVPNQFKGVFEIQFLHSSLVRATKPIQIQQTIVTDNASAAAVIQHCGAELMACPADFQLVGNADEMSSYCIDKNPRGTTDFYSAQAACIAVQNPGSGRARLCSWSEWKTACSYGAGINAIGPVGEWVSESYSPDNTGFAVGNPSCNTQAAVDISADTATYRCCMGR